MELERAISKFIRPALGGRFLAWTHQNEPLPAKDPVSGEAIKDLLLLNITSDQSIGQDYSEYGEKEIRISQRRAYISANAYEGDTYRDIRNLSSHLKRGDREGVLSAINGSFSGLSDIRKLTEKNKTDTYMPRHQIDFTIDYQETISTDTPYIESAPTKGQMHD